MARRLIDANAGVELLQRMAVNYASIGRLKEAEDYATTANILKSSACFPTIDAEPVRHGRWVWREDWGYPSISEPHELLDAYWVCSECRTDILQYLKSHFPDIPSYTECSEEVPTLERCPFCGAKMDAKEDA